MMIAAVIFDMDGLMLDTERLSLKAWEYCCGVMGLPFDRSLILKLRGTSRERVRRTITEYAGPGFDYDKANEMRSKFIADSIKRDGVPVKKGLFELLRYLRRNGYKTAVATSTIRARAMRHLDEIGVLKYFDALVFGDMVKNSKPAPDIFLLAMETISVEPQKCIILEDSPNGIRAAYNAGSNPVMIPDLTQPDQELLKLLYAKCDSLLDVIRLLAEKR